MIPILVTSYGTLSRTFSSSQFVIDLFPELKSSREEISCDEVNVLNEIPQIVPRVGIILHAEVHSELQALTSIAVEIARKFMEAWDSAAGATPHSQARSPFLL